MYILINFNIIALHLTNYAIGLDGDLLVFNYLKWLPN